jgi:site-specific DNA-cytosine methylase/DNA repair protein RadC
LPVQPVQSVEATPPPLPPEEVVTPKQEVVTDEATPPPLPPEPTEPAAAPTIKMAQAAKTLGVTPKELLRLVKAAVIPAEKRGNNYLFTQEALDAYAAERAAKQAPVLEKLAAVAGNTASEADVADLRQRGMVDIYRGQRVINQKGYDLMAKAGIAPRLTRNERVEEIDAQLGPVEKPASDIPLHPRVTKSGRLYLVRGPQGGTPAQIPITDDAQARTEANRVAAEFDAKEAELEARAAEMEQEADPAAEDEGMPELSDKDAKLVPKFYQLFVSQMRDFREARERGESTPESLDRLVTQAVAVAKRLGMANLHPGTLLMNMSRLPEGPLLRSQAAFIDAVHDVLQDGTRDIAPADLTLKAGIASPAGFTNRDSAPLSWAQMIQLGALKATPRPDGSLRVRMGKTPEQMKTDAEQAELEAMQREYLDDLRAEAGNLDKAMEDASASGFELLDAIQMAGGLPSPTSESAESHRGELTTLFESAKAMGKGAYGGKGIFVSRIFRKNAPDLDRLAQSLRGHGFDTFTPSDVLDLVDARFTENRPMYGTTTDFDDGMGERAVAAKPRVRLANAEVTTEPGILFLKKAHHGTPHKVDRFRLDKIGTGEGAQAYGWGLYFAEARAAAEEYRRRLAGDLRKKNTLDGQTITPTLAKKLKSSSDENVRLVFNDIGAFPANGTSDLKAWLIQQRDNATKYDDNYANKERIIAAYDAVIPRVGRETTQPGNLYAVELDVDDADMLDWDKPLSDQSPKVQAALQSISGNWLWQDAIFGKSGEQVGGALYSTLRATFPDAEFSRDGVDASKKASEALLAAGIPGIRYADQGSRQFNATDERLLELATKNNGNKEAAVDDFMRSVYDAPKAKEKMRADLLRNFPERTYNYVIFDENLIRIIAENGEEIGNARVLGAKPTAAQRASAKAYTEANGSQPANVAEDAVAMQLAQVASPFRQTTYQLDLFDRSAPANEPVEVAEDEYEQLVERGLAGDWKALANAVAMRGRASAILPQLVDSTIPAWNPVGTKITETKDFAALMMPIRSPYHEMIKVAVLDDDLNIVSAQIVSVGSLNEAMAHPRNVLGFLARVSERYGKKYENIIISHNHPSGDPTPSQADYRVQKNFEELASALDFNLIDHVITNGTKYYSLKGFGSGSFETPTQAEWEKVSFDTLATAELPFQFAAIAKELSQSNPDAGHIVYLNTKLRVLAVEQFNKKNPTAQELGQQIFQTVSREGAHAFTVLLPTLKGAGVDPGFAQGRLVQQLREVTGRMQVTFIDAVKEDGSNYFSFKEAGLLEEPATYLGAKPRQAQQLDLFADAYNQTAKPWTPSWQAKADTKVENAPELKLEPQTENTARIEDFGEKIEGARKDLWQKYTDAIMADLPEDSADITLAKFLPEPDYEAMLASGMEPRRVAAVRALRDLIPRKPSTGWKLRRWTEGLISTRTIIQRLVDPSNPIAIERFNLLLADAPEMRDQVELYDALGYPLMLEAKGWKLRQKQGYTTFNGQPTKASDIVSYMEKDYRMAWNLSSVVPDGDWRRGYSQTLEKFRAHLQAQAAKPAEAKKIDFQFYSDRTTGDIFIGKKGASGVIRLKPGFKSVKEASNWLTDNYDNLRFQWEEMRKEPILRKALNDPRTGPARREGDVSPEMFTEAFGFRGVQFGNYVEGERRQRDLNNAFDALMDLAEALNVPTKALSLDGALGMAFGARGTGGKRPAAAHYEPGQVVINLTKNAGPGSLAHEWFHALDNYFARVERTGSTAPKAVDEYATDSIRNPKNVRPAVMDAFRAIRNAVGTGTFAERSKKLDATRSTPYYGTTIEKAARAFETYVVERLAKSSVTNDYLANIDPSGEAYPLPQEMEGGIRQAYDILFDTLDTRETDQGVALFAKARRNAAPASSLPGNYPDTLDIVARSTKVAKLRTTGLKPGEQLVELDPAPVIAGRAPDLAMVSPAYQAAKKGGDPVAAVDISESLITQKMVDEVKARLNADQDVIFVPVRHSDPGVFHNALPAALAGSLQRRIPNSRVDTGIVKSGGMSNTGVSAAQRMGNIQTFEGEVDPSAQYVVVDDVYTSGNTLTALIDHLVSNGAEVVAAAALADSQSQNYLKPRPQDTQKLLDRAGLTSETFQRELGFPIEALTGSEIYRIANLERNWSGSQLLKERFRNRAGIFAARSRMDAERNRPSSGPQILGAKPARGSSDLVPNLAKLPSGITTFSGGGLVEIGLRGLVNPVAAVEYDASIAQAYRAAHGDHVQVSDIREVSLEKHKGAFHYHASPVCKNSSLMNSAAKGGGEKDLDVESARAVARHIKEIQPQVVTIENVWEYRKTISAGIIREALEREGYTFDEGIYNAADYGAPTARRRYLLRAVRGAAFLPDPTPVKGPGWYETIADLIDDLPDDVIENKPKPGQEYLWREGNGFSSAFPDPLNVSEPVLVSGTTLFKQVAFARATQPAFTFKASPNTVDRILLPGGIVKRLTPRAKARMTGIPDDYPLPADQDVAFTIIGNGVPPPLVRNVFGPVLEYAQRRQETPLFAKPRRSSDTTGELFGDETPFNLVGETLPPAPVKPDTVVDAQAREEAFRRSGREDVEDLFGDASSPAPSPTATEFGFTREIDAPIEKIKKDMVRFASGMSGISDLATSTFVRGGMQNYGVGFDVGLLSKNAIEALANAVVNLDAQVFIDSGAFSHFIKSQKEAEKGNTLKPLSFDKIFEKYDSILDAIQKENAVEKDYPSPLMVMPDIIGNQKASLLLTDKYKDRIAVETEAQALTPIIPIPLGELSLAQAYNKILEILNSNSKGITIDPSKFIVGIPSNAQAVSREKLAEFLSEAKPPRIHFLGAAADVNINPLLAVVAKSAPDTMVTADASKVRSEILNGVAAGKTREQAITDALFQEDDPSAVLENFSREIASVEASTAPAINTKDVGDLFAQPAPATQAMPERIAATAVIDKDGTVLSSPAKTHAELMEETKYDLDGGEFPPTQNFGFVTTTGRFVEQKEAQQIAQQARQVQGNQPISGEIVNELQREGLLDPAPAAPVIEQGALFAKSRPARILAETKGKVVAGTAVGTRNPTGKNPDGSGTDASMLVGLDAMRQDPALFRKNAMLLADYPLVAGRLPEAAALVRKVRAPLVRAQARLEIKTDEHKKAREALQVELARQQGVRKAKVKMAAVDAAIEAKPDENSRKVRGLVSRINAARTAAEKAKTEVDVAKKAFDNEVKAILANERRFPTSMAESVYQALTEMAVDNLERLIDLFPADLRDIARLWYDGANIIAQDFATRFGTTLNRSAAVLAVFSPQKDWFMNVALAERMMNVWRNHQDTIFDDAMAAQYIRRSGEPQPQWDKKLDDYKRDAQGNILYEKGAKPVTNDAGDIVDWENWDNAKAREKLEEAKADIEELKGKKLKDLPLEFQARFIRMWSEVYDSPSFPVVSPDGRFGNPMLTEKGEQRSIAWGSYNTIEKAINILSAPAEAEIQTISAELGVQHKVRSFYNNIVDPANPDGHVTMDTHAIAAILWQALSGNSPEVSQNFGQGGAAGSANLGISGLYPAFAEAYRIVAKEFNLLPREVQSITWESVRLLFPAKFKSQKANVNKVRAIWKKHEQGIITTKEAHDLIFRLTDEWSNRDTLQGRRGRTASEAIADGSGVGRPDWAKVARSGENNLGTSEKANDAGELPADGRDRDGTGRPSGGRGGAGRTAGVVPATPKGRQPGAVLGAKRRPALPPMEKRIEASLDSIENWNNVLRAAEEKPAGSVRKVAGEIREAMPYELWRGYQNLFRGRLDVADALAPGVKNILQAAQQEEALAQIGVNAVVDGLRRELQKAFGDPAFWSKNRTRLKEATRLLLPTASYLQPQRTGVDGGFEWREFERRSGTISQVEARKLRLRDGEWFQYDGRTYRLGDFLPDEKAFVLLEPISVEMQQAIYEEFWQNFPEALPILDRWITPDLKDAYTVGLGSTMSVEFNREALLSFMNEWPQDLKDAFGDLLPEVPRVEGYTPDIAAQRSIIATIARLLGIYKSPGRRFKTGALREAGNVKNLVDGFSTRAMEAHREKIRMRMREGIIEKAVVLRDDVPAENIGDYVALEDVFSSIVKAVEAARLLDKKAYPHLSKGLNPKDQVQLMKLVGDAARLNGIEQMVHKNVYRELMLSMARAQTEGILLRTLNFFLRGAKLGKLAAGSVGINWIGNQILTLTQAMNRMFAGITHLMVLDSKGAAVNTMEALFLLRGLITDRAPNTLNQSRIGDLIPRELFDNTTALSSLDAGTDYGNMVDDIKRNGILRGPAQGLVNAFKQGGISASILYAVHYSGGDAAVKQQSAYAAYRARAEVAANEAKVKSGRSEWMRNWIQKQVRENTAIHREVMDAARLYFMDYANVPAWMDPSASLPEEKGKKFLKEHGLWFIKWPYNFVRFMKRMGLDGAIETFSPSSTKQERARGLANMLTLAAIAYGGAALLSGDDEEDPIIGSRFDAEGKAKDRDQDTSSRMNLSALGRKTQLGRMVATALRMAGVNINDDLTNHRGDDYWMYYQNMTWMKEGLLMGRAVRGDMPGFLRDAGAYISDLTALGILSRMVGIAKVGSIDAKKSPVNLASEAFFEALSSPINPSALTEYINNMTDPVVRRTTSNKSLDFTMGPLESIMAKVPGLRKNLPVAGDPITPARLTLNFDRAGYMAREAKKIRANEKLTTAEKDAALANLSAQVATPVSSSGAPIDLRELLFGMGVNPAKVSDAGQTTRNIAGDLARLQAMGAGPESVRVYDEKLPSGETRTYITYPDPDNVAVRDPFLSLFKIATGVNIRPFPKPKSLRQQPSTLTPELMFNQPQANLTLPRQ